MLETNKKEEHDCYHMNLFPPCLPRTLRQHPSKPEEAETSPKTPKQGKARKYRVQKVNTRGNHQRPKSPQKINFGKA